MNLTRVKATRGTKNSILTRQRAGKDPYQVRVLAKPALWLLSVPRGRLRQ